MLKKLYKELPEKVILRYSGVTGYGEKLIQTALNVDLNEIETIAHYTAAKEFMPNVTSIVDIGGQDMKYIKLKNFKIIHANATKSLHKELIGNMVRVGMALYGYHQPYLSLKTLTLQHGEDYGNRLRQKKGGCCSKRPAWHFCLCA